MAYEMKKNKKVKFSGICVHLRNRRNYYPHFCVYPISS